MNLDSPCSCGLTVPGEELCANLAVLWAKDTLEETEPGQGLGAGLGAGEIFRIFSSYLVTTGSLTWVAHFRPHLDGRYRAFYVNVAFNTTQAGVSIVKWNISTPDWCTGG